MQDIKGFYLRPVITIFDNFEVFPLQKSGQKGVKIGPRIANTVIWRLQRLWPFNWDNSFDMNWCGTQQALNFHQSYCFMINLTYPNDQKLGKKRSKRSWICLLVHILAYLFTLGHFKKVKYCCNWSLMKACDVSQ